MFVLAIDTSSKICNVAILSEQEIIAESSIVNNFTHSKWLIPEIEHLLIRSNIDKKNIDVIATCIGPGSFTGLRIGITTAKMLAFAWQTKLIGIKTCAVLSAALPVEDIYCSPLIDAQKDTVYQSVYFWQDGKLKEYSSTKVIVLSEAIDYLTTLDKPVYIMGDFKQINMPCLPQNIHLVSPRLLLPRAAVLGELALEKLIDGLEDVDNLDLLPYYVKKSEAEVTWELKNGQK